MMGLYSLQSSPVHGFTGWHLDAVDGDDPVQFGMATYLAGIGQMSWSDVERVKAGVTGAHFDALMQNSMRGANPGGPYVGSDPVTVARFGPIPASHLNATGVTPSSVSRPSSLQGAL